MSLSDRYYADYIDKVDIDDIEYKKFSYKELLTFVKKYYYDNDAKRFISWKCEGLISLYGLKYLDMISLTSDSEYLVGIANNSKGGKTIMFCMEYIDNYAEHNEANTKIGYINTIETNYFFRDKGILKRSFEYIKEIFKDKDVLVLSPESLGGSEIEISNRVVSLFGNSLKVISEDEYINSLYKLK